VRILIDYRPALRNRTGVGEYAHEWARALAGMLPQTDQLALFSSSWKDRLARDVIPGLPVVDARVPVKLLNLAWHWLEWPPIESLAGGVDVAHSLHPLLMPARSAAQVVTIHDLYFLDNPQNTSAEIRRDYPSLAGAHARRADAVITNSRHTADQIETKLAVPSDIISICPPGAPAWPAADRYASNGPILFLGTIEPRKNVSMLLRAYAELIARRPDAPELVLAGKVSDTSSGVLDPLGRAPLAGRARHAGYVSEAEREQLYRQASMLVLPSLEEGFGMPALEAMTAGVPVVASNRGALPEVVGDAGLLVPPDDPQALAAALERMLTDAQLARRCIDRGLARARRFTWKASASRLLEAYRAAAERRRSRR
jgi:glycosyltransferase involved in cell wall biosynthesis